MSPSTLPVQSGEISLSFLCQYQPHLSHRKFVVGFTVTGIDRGFLLFVDDRELINFTKFRQRVLEKGGVLVRHVAEVKEQHPKWLNALQEAAKAGATTDVETVPNFKLIGGQA